LQNISFLNFGFKPAQKQLKLILVEAAKNRVLFNFNGHLIFER